MNKILLLILVIFVTRIAYVYINPTPQQILIRQIKALPISTIQPKPEKDINTLIQVKGVEYNVSPKLMKEIINCESGGNPNIQSQHIYPNNKYGKAGTREQSFGLVQIHLPAHKDISKTQALDTEFAVDFLASNLAQGHGRMWSCYPIALKKMK